MILSNLAKTLLVSRTTARVGIRNPLQGTGGVFYMPKSLFEEALSVFQYELQIRFSDSLRQLSQERSELIVSKMRLGQISDPVMPTLSLMKMHAPKIGRDFLDAFSSVIAPYCDGISGEQCIVLERLLENRYSIANSKMEESLKRLLISLGRQRETRNVLLSAHFYQIALGDYKKKLQLLVRKHNLGHRALRKIAVTKKRRRKKVLWRQNKSEFCRFVREEYERKPNQYKDPTATATALFKKYRFKGNWTLSKCCDLLKRVR